MHHFPWKWRPFFRILLPSFHRLKVVQNKMATISIESEALQKRQVTNYTSPIIRTSKEWTTPLGIKSSWSQSIHVKSYCTVIRSTNFVLWNIAIYYVRMLSCSYAGNRQSQISTVSSRARAFVQNLSNQESESSQTSHPLSISLDLMQERGKFCGVVPGTPVQWNQATP